jgi:hypothetical protein
MAYIPDADIVSCHVGDVPENPSTIFYHDETGNPAPTNHWDGRTAWLVKPDGSTSSLTCSVADGHGLHITWPSTSRFTAPGIYEVVANFTTTAGQKLTTEAWPFVVQGTDGWLTLESARIRWADAPADDVTLYKLLDAAKLQCQAYAPALLLGARPPVNYLEAQYLQARALYMSSISNQADSVGVDGYQVRSFPLDWNIRALLRPKKAMGGMF